jgi:PAS domain-containing protein
MTREPNCAQETKSDVLGPPDRRSGRYRTAPSVFHITTREAQVLALVLRGRGNKEIAAELGIAEQSTKKYVSELLQKFDVPNRAALAEVGTRVELTGEPGVDRAWIRQLFLDAEPQICILRGPELRYEAVNSAFRRAVGNRPTIGRTMRETFPELEGQDVFERVERVYATGEPLIEHEAQRRWDGGDGVEPRMVDVVLQPLRGEDNRVNGVVCFAVDVTHLATRRRRSEFLGEEFGTLLDLIPSAVIVVDEVGHVARLNEAASRIARLSLESTGPTAARVAHPDEGGDALSHGLGVANVPIARALCGQTTEGAESLFVGGEPPREIRVHISARPLRDADGQIRGAVAVLSELDGPGGRGPAASIAM